MKHILLIAIVSATLLIALRVSVVGVAYVQSNSMQPLINKGDGLLINQLAFGFTLPWSDKALYHWGYPEHGDIVVFQNENDNGELWLKRVIGLPGDVLLFKNHELMLNGHTIGSFDWNQEVITTDQKKRRQYKTWSSWLEEDWGPITVSESSLFVMGDHRGASIDSRVWGTISFQSLRGRASLRFWPVSKFMILNDDKR